MMEFAPLRPGVSPRRLPSARKADSPSARRAVSSVAGAALCALAATACAGKVDYAGCDAPDWFALGRTDGAAGAPIRTYEDRLQACAADITLGDPDQYALGWRDGATRYCSPQNGFEAGRDDLPYRDVCPEDLEPAFLAGYEDGRRLHKIDRAYGRAVAAYRDAVDGLARHKTDLNRARKRYMDPYLSGAERFAVRQDVDFHEREIARLERDIPLMDADLSETRQAMETLRAEMRARYALGD